LNKNFIKKALATIPPPPPPYTEPPKKSRKMLLAGVVVAIIIIAVVVAAVALSMNSFSAFTNTSQSQNVQQASSLKFSVSSTGTSEPYAYTLQVKNIGTQNMMIRVEGTLPGVSQDVIYIINGVQQKAWGYANGQWTDISSTYNTQWSTWTSIFNDYRADLSKWSGTGDYSYTNPSTGETIKIYDIQVNPQLPDSAFAP
jgi:type II secretory pathway pseudopilin PulG